MNIASTLTLAHANTAKKTQPNHPYAIAHTHTQRAHTQLHTHASAMQVLSRITRTLAKSHSTTQTQQKAK